MLPLGGSKAYVSKGLAERLGFKYVCMCAVTRNKHPHKGMRVRNSILASSHFQRANLGLELKILVKIIFGWVNVSLEVIEYRQYYRTGQII